MPQRTFKWTNAPGGAGETVEAADSSIATTMIARAHNLDPYDIKVEEVHLLPRFDKTEDLDSSTLNATVKKIEDLIYGLDYQDRPGRRPTRAR